MFIIYPYDSSMNIYAGLNSMPHMTRPDGILEVEFFANAVMCSEERYFKISPITSIAKKR
jgi:hypothetical protein